MNLVVWPDLKEKQRKVVMGSRLMEVRGRVEYDDEVIHVIAHHMTDATHQLAKLSEDMLPTPIARADHVNNPLPDAHKRPPPEKDDSYAPLEAWQEGQGGEAIRPRNMIDELPPTRGHPRNARIIPKSRDFH